MRRPCTFKKTDLTRAVKALLAAGITIARVEFDPATGKFGIRVTDDSDAQAPPNEWDNPK